jgi:hypothetical protein
MFLEWTSSMKLEPEKHPGGKETTDTRRKIILEPEDT